MDFVPVRINTLRGGQIVPFHIYLLLNEKYIHYIRGGESFEAARLNKLKDKKVKKLFIQVQDETKYRDYLDMSFEDALNSKSQKSVEDRAAVIQGAMESKTDDLMADSGSAQKYNTAKVGAGRYAEFLIKEDRALANIFAASTEGDKIAQHGVTVAGLAVKLAQELGITDAKKLELLTLGALLHDIGHVFNNFKNDKKFSSFSDDDKKIHLSHARIGAEKVREHRHFDPQVIDIIAQHEECIDGSGPLGLAESKIDPIALIVSTVNKYDRYLIFEGLTPEEALKKFLIDMVGRFPLSHINGLKNVLDKMKSSKAA